ncbi:hypothetical protein [Acetilactobacillus jinshanensis]|uniref:hypothetical protein n=1 Tax=Acetilactobacillus jinshanensis TaxID=1720083 RepID=UPI0013A6096C|nr:hypothetical protein [Acetilactobacillus jinshanensis]URL61164.1 hypothetical protein HGK75_03990 [uncultured bacterium]
MNQRKLKLIKQLHQIYGNRIDSVLDENPDSPVYTRTCHLNGIQKMRKRLNK